jgi:hypothetical protein
MGDSPRSEFCDIGYDVGIPDSGVRNSDVCIYHYIALMWSFSDIRVTILEFLRVRNDIRVNIRIRIPISSTVLF